MATKPAAEPMMSRQEAAEQARSRTPVTDRVNVEPSILRGMTATEAKIVTFVSVPFCLLIGGIFFAFTGRWQVLMAFLVFGPLIALWVLASYLQKIKRGKPDGHYTQAIHLWLAHRGYISNKFIEHDGAWDLGRTLEFSLQHPFSTKKFYAKWLRSSKDI